MKHLLFAVAALAMIAPVFAVDDAQSSGNAGQIGGSQWATPPKVQTSIVINPPGTGAQNGIEVVNGNVNGQYPELAGSSGTVRLKRDAGNPKKTNAVCDNGLKARFTGLSAGQSITLSVNSLAIISGTGGDATIAGGSNVTVKCLDQPGATNIVVHMPGGTSTTLVPPGNQVMFLTQ